MLVQFQSHPLFPLFSLLVGSLVSGCLTWFFAWWYYKSAGEELRNEAAQLHRATSTIVYFLENRNPNLSFKAKYDDAGNVVSVEVTATGASVATSSAAGVVADGKTHS